MIDTKALEKEILEIMAVHFIGELNDKQTRDKVEVVMERCIESLGPGIVVECTEIQNPPELIDEGGLGFQILIPAGTDHVKLGIITTKQGMTVNEVRKELGLI